MLSLPEDNGGWNINSLTFAASGGGGIDTSAWYEVVNQNSGSCVDDTSFGTANGTPAQQWSCGGGTNQQWQFRPAGAGSSMTDPMVGMTVGTTREFA